MVLVMIVEMRFLIGNKLPFDLMLPVILVYHGIYASYVQVVVQTWAISNNDPSHFPWELLLKSLLATQLCRQLDYHGFTTHC